MADLLVLVVTLAVFVFGFFVVKKIDVFIEENHRAMRSADAQSSRCVRIASENPAFFDAVAAALESCANSCMDLRLSSACAKRVLNRLSDGSIDIALLSEERKQELGDGFGRISIPYFPNPKGVTALGLTVENMDGEGQILLVWDKAVQSKDRDRVLFVLENGHLRQECGDFR